MLKCVYIYLIRFGIPSRELFVRPKFIESVTPTAGQYPVQNFPERTKTRHVPGSTFHIITFHSLTHSYWIPRCVSMVVSVHVRTTYRIPSSIDPSIYSLTGRTACEVWNYSTSYAQSGVHLHTVLTAELPSVVVDMPNIDSRGSCTDGRFFSPAGVTLHS